MKQHKPDPMDHLREDWQQTDTAPVLSLDVLKKRLRRRWGLAALDVLGLAAVAGLLAWSVTWLSGPLEWIYWGFFALVFVVSAVVTVRLRLHALWRVDDSVAAVLEHVRRDASMRVRAGRMAFWLSLLILGFVGIWMLIAGWLDSLSLTEFLADRVAVLVFATMWCLLGMAVGGFICEKGNRQLLELDRLGQELEQ